ncbi:MAG: UPF0280 family protein [Sedimentitalea sp.]|nr:UPF0280 family protein [Sedimentitalea sp.]
MAGPQVAFLPDGRRLHLNHGPIDLIVDAEGPGRAAGLRAAVERFDTILQELVDELPELRRPLRAQHRFRGAVARAMADAVRPHGGVFVTPMAAVAGAVADAMLRVTCAPGGITRAYVNNGGDVALHLAEGARFTAALAGTFPARATVTHADPVRGIATSGWRGRSHSLGIADSVTVLARNAAAADAAATLIANAVDLPGCERIRRVPARDLAPDSDLGARPVTVAVGPLTGTEIARALARGTRFAEDCRRRGLIHAALLSLAGESGTVGPVALTDAMTGELLHA